MALLAVLAGDTSRALDLLEALLPEPGFLSVWDSFDSIRSTTH